MIPVAFIVSFLWFRIFPEVLYSEPMTIFGAFVGAVLFTILQHFMLSALVVHKAKCDNDLYGETTVHPIIFELGIVAASLFATVVILWISTFGFSSRLYDDVFDHYRWTLADYVGVASVCAPLILAHWLACRFLLSRENFKM